MASIAIPIPSNESSSSSSSSESSFPPAQPNNTDASINPNSPPSRKQVPGDPLNRVAPQSIPAGGLVPQSLATPDRAGTGSVGNARRPFKV